jgi:hypothetical protein
MKTLTTASTLVVAAFLTAGLFHPSLGMTADKERGSVDTSQYQLSSALMLNAANTAQDPDGGYIASGETRTGSIFPGGDTDPYYLWGRAGQGLATQMATISGGLNPRLQLYDPDGVRVAEAANNCYNLSSLVRIENYRLKKTGVYTIVASNACNVATGDYGLSLVLAPGAASSPQDPDGGDINSGETRTGTISPGGDMDPYRVYCQAGEGVVIEVADISAKPTLYPRLQFYDPNGVRVVDASNYCYNPSHVMRIENYQCKMTGIYTIVVSHDCGVATGEYGFSVNVFPHADPHGLYPCAPQPPDGNSVSLCGANTLSWWPVTGATGYDVCFSHGPSVPLKKVAENIAYPWVAMPAVDGNEVCYWQVVAHMAGGDIQGPTWWFATVRCPNSIVIYDFPLDSNPEWTMTGQWAFGKPTGEGGPYGYPDPTGGHTGLNVIGVNLNGCYDPTPGPLYSVVAGPFDLSDYKDVRLKFWRWLNADWADYVESSVEISTDSKNTWSPVWRHFGRTEIADSQWTPVEYDISAQADGQRALYVRWSYQVLKERAYSYSGWNLDDIQLIGQPR